MKYSAVPKNSWIGFYFAPFVKTEASCLLKQSKRHLSTATHITPVQSGTIFRGLFRSIDQGNTGLDIPAYNGGLFAV